MRKNRVPERLLFISLMLTGLIFLFAPQRLTSKFQFAFVRVFCWPLSIGRDISLSAYGFMASAEGSPENIVSRERYDKLHNRLANVTEWLKQERQKVETLSGLRNRPAWKGVNFVLADIITSTIDGLHNELIINRGRKDGLAEGQFVLANESIIGTICKADNRTARVKLITDPASKIAVKIEGLSKDRILQGSGGNSANVKLLPTKGLCPEKARIPEHSRDPGNGRPVRKKQRKSPALGYNRKTSLRHRESYRRLCNRHESAITKA